MTTIAYLVGARPNYVKTAPVLHELSVRLPSARHVLIETGQHYDYELAGLFLDELAFPEPNHVLGVRSGSHGEQTARALEGIERALELEQPDILIVPGDVNSTLAGALAASKLGVRIAHLEAGLRSFDRSMPEEINRVLVDQISDWCFTHSPEAADNLRNEGVGNDRIYYVGNTMIDTLVRLLPRIAQSEIHSRLRLEHGQYVLVTLHRPALVDGSLLGATICALERLSGHLPVVFPVHPRTRVQVNDRPHHASLQFVDPLGYLDFLALEVHAAAVIRLRRSTGGDDVPPYPMFHAPSEHRAADHA